jgi:hypothetical protein
MMATPTKEVRQRQPDADAAERGEADSAPLEPG